MANKGLIGGLSAILLVAAVVGVVAGVYRTTHNTAASSSTLSTSSKSVQAVCATTSHQDICQQTLNQALSGDLNPKDVIQATVNATIEKVKYAFEHTGNLSASLNDPKNADALAECKRLLDDSIDNLKAVLLLSHNFEDLKGRQDDVRVWLNGVISYQQACTVNIEDPKLKAAINDTVSMVVQFASNALAFVKDYASVGEEIASAFNISFGSPSRRLLGAGKDEFPSWFSAADRRLLRGGGGVGAGAGTGAPPQKPNVVVALDGTGDFNSINAAVKAMPKNYTGRYIIYVKAGLYKEQVTIDKTRTNIYMYGDGAKKSIVTGALCNTGGVKTAFTASFITMASGFIAKNMGFTNTAGAVGHQAVALRVQGDMSAFFNCRMDGYQDTLYAQSNRQFYHNCVVSGTIDFIFGDSFTYIQNSLIILRKPMANQQNTVTAQGRDDPKEDTVIVIQNCRIVPDSTLFPDRLVVKSYLGRPWKNFANTVIMESQIGDVINPAGYLEWPGNNMNTVFYGEYGNRGPGAVTTGRVKWAGVKTISRADAMKYTSTAVLEGQNKWLAATGETYITGLKN